MVLNDVVQLICGNQGSKVRLTITKPDASSWEISVIRAVVILEEGFAKSCLLETEDQELIGLISLPQFYSEPDNHEGYHCADDVAVEIEKFKQEGVKGIIFDLRDNGGGFTQQATRMFGFSSSRARLGKT